MLQIPQMAALAAGNLGGRMDWPAVVSAPLWIMLVLCVAGSLGLLRMILRHRVASADLTTSTVRSAAQAASADRLGARFRQGTSARGCRTRAA